MIKIKINNLEFLVQSDISVLEACKYVGITVPRFCYHETLSVAGNCRMCLVEIEKSPKPVASCAFPVSNNIQIFVDTPLVKKARENVLETLLLNHPLDCPICDQGGECDLQDQTKLFGTDYSRFFINKRGVEDKYCGPLIKTIMTRCIHCTRCVRFGAEIAGVDYLGTLNRGSGTEIGGYISKMFNSEISGNVIDLCPVGALTSKPYTFKARPWELRSNESIDLMDSTGSNIYVNFKESEILRVLPKTNLSINGSIITDKARFSYDSLKNHRLQRIFEITEKNTVINWSVLLPKIEAVLKSSKKTMFLINDELNMETLLLLKKIATAFPETIQLRNISLFGAVKNIFLSWGFSKIIDINIPSKICFLISSNIRLESAILNTKLRTKYLDQDFSIYSLGQTFNSTFPMQVVNLNVNSILNIFQGKDKTISKLLLSCNNPFIFLGEGLNTRLSLNPVLNELIKKHIPTAKIFFLDRYCNTQTLRYLGVNALSRGDFLVSDIIFAVNLEDNVLIRKQLASFNKNLIWLNSHGSEICLKANFLIPTPTFFEEEGIFVNLEQRPQKALKTLAYSGEVRSLSSILFGLYPNINTRNNFNSKQHSNFFNEIVETPKLFDLINKKFYPIKFFETSLIQYKKYPLKSLNQNFYFSNNFTRNSKIMSQCTQDSIKNTPNF